MVGAFIKGRFLCRHCVSLMVRVSGAVMPRTRWLGRTEDKVGCLNQARVKPKFGAAGSVCAAGS